MHKSQKSTIQMTNKIFQKNVPMYKLLGRMYMNMNTKILNWSRRFKGRRRRTDEPSITRKVNFVRLIMYTDN